MKLVKNFTLSLLSRLSKLKLEAGRNPYEFIGEMKTLERGFRNSNVNVDTVLQYFFWNAIPTELQSQLIIICNNDKPSLEMVDIKENIFKALKLAIASS